MRIKLFFILIILTINSITIAQEANSLSKIPSNVLFELQGNNNFFNLSSKKTFFYLQDDGTAYLLTQDFRMYDEFISIDISNVFFMTLVEDVNILQLSENSQLPEKVSAFYLSGPSCSYLPSMPNRKSIIVRQNASSLEEENEESISKDAMVSLHLSIHYSAEQNLLNLSGSFFLEDKNVWFKSEKRNQFYKKSKEMSPADFYTEFIKKFEERFSDSKKGNCTPLAQKGQTRLRGKEFLMPLKEAREEL